MLQLPRQENMKVEVCFNNQPLFYADDAHLRIVHLRLTVFYLYTYTFLVP